MKDNRIDKLFEAGLSQNKLTPPPAAWDKIEAELPSKSKKGAWFLLSIAASLVLALSLGWIFIGQSSIEDTKEQIQAQNQEQQQPVVKEKIEQESEPTQEAIPLEIIEPKDLQTTNNLADLTPAKPEKIIDKEVLQETSPTELNALIIIETASLKALNQQSLELLNDFKFQHISFDINESLQAYLSQQPEVRTALPKKKRFTVLSGIVSVAKGVNSSKEALSDIRQSKNEFVMNELKYGEKTESSDDDLDSPVNR